MGKHTVISEVGNALVNLLRQELVPEIILNPDTIMLYNPGDKGDVILGLYLYDIRECEEIRLNEMISLDSARQKYPSSFLTLNYMITAYSNTDVKYRASEDQRILGKVVQCFADNSLLNTETLQPTTKGGGLELRIQMLRLETEEKQRLWSVPNQPYRTSLYYKIAPVEMESARIKTVQRIVDVDFTIKE